MPLPGADVLEVLVQVLRTPEDRFTDLPGYPWPAAYPETSDGLRLAVVDQGPADAPVVLLLHGEPTWSYLYRKMIPVLVQGGFRVVAPDNIGFGRSDKPSEVSDHSYARHVQWLRSALFDALDLRDVVLFCQDWGGLLGLRLVAEHPDRFAAVCASNTGLPDGSQPMGQAWQRFHAMVEATADLAVGSVVSAGCVRGLSDQEVTAYDAPFPSAAFKAGPRALPGLVPRSREDAQAANQRAAWAVLETFDKPFLVAFSDQDPITAGGQRPFLERIPGTRGQPHTTITGAGHFVQEDHGEHLAHLLRDWALALD